MRRDVHARRMNWLHRAGAIALGLGFGALALPPLRAQSSPGTQGRWTTLPYTMPVNPVHLALMNNGKVLIVAGSGNVAAEANFRAAVWDPQAETFVVTQSLGWDMFCNGMVVLPDGRVFINGGNLQYDPFHGEPRNAVFDPATGLFTNLQNMAHGRWYPTVTTLGDGRVMTFSGLTETGATNTAVEIYTAGSGWSPEYPAGWTPPLYPRMHLLPDGTVLYAGSGTGSRLFNPVTKTWSSVVATTNSATTRTYGTSVLLPLTPANGYKPRVMIFGGGNPATGTTEILDLSVSPLKWQWGPAMSQHRIEMNATILPNGKVLVLGGSRNDEDAATASLNADLFDPALKTFSTAGANAFPRLYHSGSLLLPDATVLLVGGNPTRAAYETRMEIYSPAYLFNADQTPAFRPAITGVTPGTLVYGGAFQVHSPDAADIASVVLVRPGAPTHSFDMDQRMVGLSYSIGGGVLNVTAPPNGNIAPPGYYMLFILNAHGTPSVASFVHLSPAAPNQAPTATISSPASNVRINPGQSVSFAGAGSDPDGTINAYAWTLPGGNPGSSAQAAAGAVTYSTAGAYNASFRVTDNLGLTSASTTRTVTVSDFSISATPATRAVQRGSSTSYAATLASGSGFTGTVAFSVAGLPTGATASFAPASIVAAGSTTMSVSTSTATAVGTYTLTIRATSGPVVRSANVTLTVTAPKDFSISATPSSRTVARGASTTYSTSIVPLQGFSSSVALSVKGLPTYVSAAFSPASITQSGTSVLKVTVKTGARTGTYTLTITGTSGSLVHSSKVVLVVR
jgi:hypothetical protein